MSLTTFHALFLHELSDLYDAELQLTQALPKMASAAKDAKLKKAFKDHLKQTQGHVKRLENVFKSLGEGPEKTTCNGMKGLISEGEKALDEESVPSVLDAALITAAQRVEHYEIAAYGSALEFAKMMKHRTAAKLLNQTLKEEGNADKLLNKIALASVNPTAMKKASGMDKKGRR